MLTYGSVCSGIEAATIAWEPLGFKPAWFAQFDPDHKYKNGPDFPSAVLAYRWPEVQNLGDMTKIAAAVRAGIVEAPDIGVGGTPCQAFSVAGARAGLADPRGQLTIAYVDLADAIDESRLAAGKDPAIFVWENVPGVLSSKDNAFGAFLGLLAGEDCELQPPGKKWSNVGYVRGLKRAIAWRILDAQYFGVAQRRRRVFVIASARTDIDPAKILFESESLRRDISPSRNTREIVAALTANGVGTCGADDNQGQAGHLIAGTIAAHSFIGGAGGRPEGAAAGHFIPVGIMAHGQGGAEIKTDNSSPTLTCNHEVPIVFSCTGAGTWSKGPGTLRARQQESHEHLAVLSVHGTQDPDTLKDMAHTLGRNHGQENAVIAFSSKDNGHDAISNLSPTLRACNIVNSNQNAGGPPAIAYSLQHAQIGRKDDAGPQGKGWQEEVGFTLDSRADADVVAVAFAENSRAEVRVEGGDGLISGTLSTGGGKPGQGCPTIAYGFKAGQGAKAMGIGYAEEQSPTLTSANSGSNLAPTVMKNMAVRRLTPVECERLQGFPDNHTLIPTKKRKKITAEEYLYLRHHFPNITAEDAYRKAVDGPRYKAIGNSMAVPVMQWIGKRIIDALEGKL